MNLLHTSRSYVLEHLLGRYYASDDPAEIELGIAAVKALDLSPGFGAQNKRANRFLDWLVLRCLAGPTGLSNYSPVIPAEAGMTGE